jgi:transcription termination factor Rho
MSEESDNQPPADDKPAAATRRRPARRTPRAKNESKPRARKSTSIEAAAPESGEPKSEKEQSSGNPPATAIHPADGDGSQAAAATERRQPDAPQNAADSPDTEAPKIASNSVAAPMRLGSDEGSSTLSQGEAAEAVATPPDHERQFHGRRRGRDGYRDRNRDRRTDDDRDQNRDRPQGGGSPDNGDRPPQELEFGEGIIEISGKGFGFLRDPKRNFVQTPQDIFVTPEIVRRFALRDGMWVQGETRRGNRGPQLMRLNKINDDEPTKYQDLRPFEELTTINPDKRIKLETVPDRYTTRIMDLMTPLGMGQRGIIVAPPRTGKTTLLHHIADAVTKNHPEMKLIILLVDERPEEVTDFRRSCPGAEIMASSNDSDIKSHTRIAQLAIERSKRMVEAGKHVFILLDSITRTARAFNNATGGGGRTMSGGIDSRAMEIPRKIFAAARNTEEAGSLTIVATALIETGSRMDELIFQEFKGTGNMELVLDRKISDSRVYPAVDIFLSGTRREELLLQSWELEKINLIRRGLAGHKPQEAIERLLMFVKKFPTNTQMLKEIPG